MSNCHSELLAFDRTISLTQAEVRKLAGSRDSIQQRIKFHFKQKGYPIPEFKGQGSFTMGTSIRPVEGDYDLDLGVYLKGLGTDPDEWPRTETIHNLIYEAVNGQTSLRPIRKATCVRVLYKPPYSNNKEISYHIDLPVYAYKETFWNDIKIVIGQKGDKQWSERSDPEQFTKWFFERCAINAKDKDQLKRIVKYLKAWKENAPASPALPSGMILTVLAAKNYKPDFRDDVALFETVNKFHYLLDWQFSIMKPTEPLNNLAEFISNREEENFMKRTEAFLDLADRAINENNHKKSLSYWKRIFGDRFLNESRPRML